jgi:uncharacterized protein (DUF58 family)
MKLKQLKAISFTNLLYGLLLFVVVIFSLGHFLLFLKPVGRIILFLLISFTVVDCLLLFILVKSIPVSRLAPERFSNGDENEICITLQNLYPFKVEIAIVDEIPGEFQIRDFKIKIILKAGEERTLCYKLRPVRRGEFIFGNVRLAVTGNLKLAKRHFKEGKSLVIAVYPSFLQMKHYELLAISNRLNEAGIKKLRKMGQQFEFDHIRDYVRGDDWRNVNWKATATRSRVMLNQFQDEKSQNVYSLIDMGRSMKMPFEEMSLLDYAINASLVISNTAINKYDKAGLIAFNNVIHTILPAERRNSQMEKIQQSLYKLESGFSEPDYEMLYTLIKRKIRQRSLLILFTNIESMASMRRYSNIFGRLAKEHVMLVVLFENTEVDKLIGIEARNLDEVYIKTIAEKFILEKKLIARELNRRGVHTVLTKPAGLSVSLINSYLEFKSRGII